MLKMQEQNLLPLLSVGVFQLVIHSNFQTINLIAVPIYGF